jgi:uncharacterized CHY-type Zn-finger protein
MSHLISSFIIDPVVRQARRFSGAVPSGASSTSSGRSSLSHVNGSATTPPSAAHVENNESSTDSANDGPITQVTGLRPSSLTGQFRGSQSAVVDDEEEVLDGNDGRALEGPASLPTAASQPIDISVSADTSASPASALENHLRRLDLDPPLSTTPANAATHSRTVGTTGAFGRDAAIMPESLPADDGMRYLRARIHEIRELAIADTEKAMMMHTLMTERYNHLRPQSPSSFVSHDRPSTPTLGLSTSSDFHASSPLSVTIDPENPFNLRPGDQEPTYRLRSTHHNTDNTGEDEDFDTAEDGSSMGCQHYKRNVKVQCHQCRRWYTCRHCHDAVEDHNLNRRKTENMLCMTCGIPQAASQSCENCGMRAAWYYCDICKLWDDNSSKKIYHCLDCGICRMGEGLGKDYIHCKVR